MGQKNPYHKVIPLCPDHHRHGGYGVAFHAGKETWETTYGNEEFLLKIVEEKLKWRG